MTTLGIIISVIVIVYVAVMVYAGIIQEKKKNKDRR
jgi:uncharacterized membrane protein